MASSLPLPTWPNDADVAVCLTFDVDAEAPFLGPSPDAYEPRLTTLSEGRYGVVRSLGRILDLLDAESARGTFYVPGSTAERHPDAIRELAATEHEIAHHGHLHLRSHLIDAQEQRVEIERGFAALAEVADVTPVGYRSPAWELTPETFALLIEHGFAYDSSCMGDDRPYLEHLGEDTLLEIPVHWSLDDWAFFGWSDDEGGTLTSPSAWIETWLEEFESALEERRLITLTMHPEIIGRGYRIRALRRLIQEMKARGNVWFATHGEVAQLAAAMAPPDAQPIRR